MKLVSEQCCPAQAAAQLLRRYVRKTLGVAATRISAFASYIEAAAAAVEGKEQEAQELCQAALMLGVSKCAFWGTVVV